MTHWQEGHTVLNFEKGSFWGKADKLYPTKWLSEVSWGKKNNLEANEHAYIVFGKNINVSKHIREQKEILLRIKSVPETFSIGVKVIFFSFLLLGEGQLTEDKRETVGDSC